MKLRNKRTGEIGELHYEPDKEYHFTVATEDPADMMIFKSLAELSEEWEDYEEPTTYYYISDFGAIREGDAGKFVEDEIVRKEIGNYFETEEEAEKAVEKLKAWKRLKDKGFRFIGKTYETDKRFGSIFYKVDEDTYSEDIIKELDLLFGGEE